MKRIGLATALALFAPSLSLLSAPVAAHAAAPAAKPEPAKPYDKDALTKGAKEGPAVLAKTQLKCTPTGWGFAGQGTVKDPETKKDSKQSVYEVSCQEGLGYSLISTAETGAVQSYDCLTLADAAASQVKCRLPGNLDVKAQLQPLVTATGRTCTVTGGRAVGATKAGDAFYEVSCQGALGYLIKTSATAKPEATDCALELGTNVECKLTTKEQIDAAQKARITELVAKSGKTCTISGSRAVGRLTTGEDLYEVACGPGAGYMIRAKADNSALVALECAKAEGYAGGCQLTNTASGQTAEAATYTRLAKAAGYDCNVAKYHYIGLDEKKNEVVELACGNRPDGAIAVFPSNNARGSVYDCVAAGTLGTRCQLSEPSQSYGKYTQALVAKGKTTCKVSNARWLGRYEGGSDLIETACADGAPGWVIEMAQNSVKSLFTCGQAKASGVACQLGGNTK